MFEQSTPNRSQAEAAARNRSSASGWMRGLAFTALAALFAAPTLLRAQAYTPPPPPLTTAPCVPTKKDPCPPPSPPPPATVDEFPFPGSPQDPSSKPVPSPPPSDNFPFPGEGPGPGSPAPAAKPGVSADKFPFPGENAGSSSSGNSSSSNSSSSGSPSSPDDTTPAKPSLKDRGSSGSTPSSRRRLAKVEDLNEREAKDLEVSQFYLTSGDYLGAYNRAKDAIRLFPDDPEAHFALAAAAQKLKKNDEAAAEYKSYLKLEPDGDHVKVAQRALTEIH